METIRLVFDRDQHSLLRLASGKVIGDCTAGLNDELNVELHDLPKSRMSIERQDEVVRACLMCKTTGQWGEFESLASKILLEQLGLDPDALSPPCEPQETPQ